MKATAELDADDRVDGTGGHGAPRLRWRSAPPIVLRPTGPRRVHLVQAAGGPLGGDELGLIVRVGAAGCLQLRSAGATVVQSGPAPARWSVTADVAGGAVLDWGPQPTVVCDGAELHSSVRVQLRAGAGAVLREEIVLGRAGQRGGRYRGALAVELDGAPLLVHTLVLDGADPALTGPAGTGGGRAVGALAVVGEAACGPPVDAGEEPGLRWCCSRLEGPGRLLLAVGDNAATVARFLDMAASRVSLGAAGLIRTA